MNLLNINNQPTFTLTVATVTNMLNQLEVELETAKDKQAWIELYNHSNMLEQWLVDAKDRERSEGLGFIGVDMSTPLYDLMAIQRRLHKLPAWSDQEMLDFNIVDSYIQNKTSQLEEMGISFDCWVHDDYDHLYAKAKLMNQMYNI